MAGHIAAIVSLILTGLAAFLAAGYLVLYAMIKTSRPRRSVPLMAAGLIFLSCSASGIAVILFEHPPNAGAGFIILFVAFLFASTAFAGISISLHIWNRGVQVSKQQEEDRHDTSGNLPGAD